MAVVGAGPGGLAAALLLAASGASVDVYEALPQVGGRSRRLELNSDRGAFRFDVGPTFFMMPYVLDEILAASGAKLSDHVELQRLDPMYRLLLGRPEREPITLDTTQDLHAMERRLSAIEPGDGPAFLRFIDDNRRKLAAMTPLLRRPMRSVLDLLSADTLRAGPRLRPWQSLHEHLGGYFKHPQIRLALSFQSKYLGMSPFECPELFSILPFIEYEYGIWHPRGGCNALMEALRGIAEELGVRFHFNAPVEAIAFEGRRAVGVQVDGALRHHPHVVVNADAAAAMKRLIPESLRGQWSDRSIDRKRYSCSTYMMYLGLEGEIELPHHTIYASRSYERNLREITTEGVLSEDPSMYVCNPTPLDDSMAPRGHSSLYVLVPTPNTQPGSNRVEWRESNRGLRERALDQLDHVFGLGDLRPRIRAEQRTTPADWATEGIHFGATFNLAHTLGQMLHKRPQHRMKGVDGVWFVGGGTHPGSGLPVIFLSSQITSRLLCAELGLRCALDAPPPRANGMLRAWKSPTASI
ncbi:MAG: phytoene desaturase [Planctomycetes bacterium]|nr:phytoene desaturase [Planctomycetota bacterium]